MYVYILPKLLTSKQCSRTLKIQVIFFLSEENKMRSDLHMARNRRLPTKNKV